MSREKKSELLRMLEFLKQENILLKQRLMEALQLDSSRQFLERAESLQQQFLQNDQALALMHHDLVMLYQKHSDGKSYLLQREGLESDLGKMKEEIGHLRMQCADLPNSGGAPASYGLPG
ncbi:hypothetical protein [Chitinophaga caseinilytica]|uniref:FlgN protein n=1 Tax=Chitinophaga caseinilytica TaxID=2267521 RepID=A0ABZ2ZCJ6_9BACT